MPNQRNSGRNVSRARQQRPARALRTRPVVQAPSVTPMSPRVVEAMLNDYLEAYFGAHKGFRNSKTSFSLLVQPAPGVMPAVEGAEYPAFEVYLDISGTHCLAPGEHEVRYMTAMESLRQTFVWFGLHPTGAEKLALVWAERFAGAVADES